MKKGMLKKFVACGLAMVMVVGTLASCGGTNDASQGTDAASQTAVKGTLTVGLDDTFAPMGFRDKDNNLVGFDIDLANKVGEELGMKVEFKPIAWDTKDMELKSRNIDCVWNGMSATPERMEEMALSNKYLDNTIILMALKDADVNIAKAEDLAKYKIGTQADSAALDMLKNNEAADSFMENVSEYPEYDKALMALKSGRVDVLAIDQVLGEYKNKNLDGALKVCEYTLGQDAYTIGFRKEDTALRDAVNDALQKLLDEGTSGEISNNWFGKDIVMCEEVK